ncbi:MAG: MBL fold metallo-hydrolase [Propionibacteriaceae bacterium]|nr:MBL fold metallo-hydrolase [Propionibacteriaceae bacterium]
MTPVAPTLTFLGAVRTVTGSKHLLTVGERRILVDAGMFQGRKDLRELNWRDFPIPPDSISDVLLTHAHADHSTYLPVLVKNGFTGSIWCTEGTRRLAEIVLRDAGYLQELTAAEARRGGWSKHPDPRPLYTVADVERTLPLLRPVPYGTDIDLGGGVSARWVRAAHMLGSASIRVEALGVSVIFSGDLGRHDHPLLANREVPEPADYVVMESTYGDREHDEPDLPHVAMADAINRTIARGGTVVIPAFAIDRTEVVLHALTQLYRAGRIPDVPVVVDSPMALRALAVYKDLGLGEMRPDITVDDFVGLPRLIETPSAEESKKLNRMTEPMIIVSSSGMAEGGRVLFHLKRLLGDERNCVILSGYQAEGTRGRALATGARAVKIHGAYVPVRAEVVQDREFSAHGDASDLMDWLRDLSATGKPPRIVFLVHGEEKTQHTFAGRIQDELGIVAVVPRYREVVALTAD